MKILFAREVLLVFLACGVTHAVAQGSKHAACLQLLGAGMYNGLLEDTCGFKEGVKDQLKASYSNAGCRTVVTQDEVDQTSANVTTNANMRYQKIGRKNFCAGNKAAYEALISQPQTQPKTAFLPKFKKGEDYGAIRQTLMTGGWMPFHAKDADKCMDGDDRCKGRPEMEVCAGTGLAACKFLWTRGSEKLAICTVGEEQAKFNAVCDFPR